MSARSFELIKRKQGNINIPSLSPLQVTLHENLIIDEREPRTMILSSCGWRTPTTKVAINRGMQLLGVNIRVQQNKGEWFLVTHNDVGNISTVEFFDGIQVRI